MMQRPKLIVCDLDDTLYDWVSYFVRSFYAMVEVAVDILDCERELLLDEFREVHRRHHNSEHPFALMETSTVQNLIEKIGEKRTREFLDPAFHAFNSERKRSLSVFPNVHMTLETLKSDGIKLIAHTESNLYAVTDRLWRLELHEYFDKIYCREKPEPIRSIYNPTSQAFRDFPFEKIVELRRHQRKPSSKVLLEICEDAGVSPNSVAYLGDSIARDIMMAKDAGVFSIWAEYGSHHSKSEYEQLVRVSHWTDEDVRREKLLALKAKDIQPDVSLSDGIHELLDVLSTRDQKRFVAG